MRICVILPTYNEAKEISRLAREIRRQNLDALVIDDGSSDNTSRLAMDSGATVLRNLRNEGKGASLIKGFDYALSHGYDAVITMDGDGQHLTQDLPVFIQAALAPHSQIIVGNRMQMTTAMPRVRVLTNKFMSWLISVLTKQNIPDTQCGFRLIKKEALQKISLTTNKYETESEILIQGARLGFKIVSVPVKTVYLNEKSHIHPFKDTLRFIRFVLKELWTPPR